MTDYAGLIRVLADGHVDFVLVGGLAAIVHGSARLTLDVDVVYSRALDNLERIVAALSGHAPYLRGAPPGLPFTLDAPTLRAGLNFTLTTRLGDLDLLGEITGGGRFNDLVPHAMTVQMFDRDVLCINLRTLISVKRAAGRPKDLEAIAELEAIEEEIDAARRREHDAT
jgi:hypothetical protein